ncbi:MAG: hypothetical protein DMG52_28610 [Acidobacteria bacterium]|nr:MAG: hypothetical protein DMG52_28610 [Acidobacteriota bacterium]
MHEVEWFISENMKTKVNVDDFVTAEAICSKQLSTKSNSAAQKVCFQSLQCHRISQISIKPRIWFGTRTVDGSNPLAPTNSQSGNGTLPRQHNEFDSTWLHLNLKGAATPSKHETFGLGIQFDSHRPLHASNAQNNLAISRGGKKRH